MLCQRMDKRYRWVPVKLLVLKQLAFLSEVPYD